MKKLISMLVIPIFILCGCDNFTKKVPDTMPVNEYTGQGFQPRAEKDVIEAAKKHKKEYAELGERFFKDNFGLKVTATNVVGSGDGIEVFVHCDDHDIVFNSSVVLSKDFLGHKGSMRAKGESDDLSTLIGDVVSGFDYKANKKEYDKLYQYFKDNQKKYGYYGYTREAINKTQNSGYQNEFFWISGVPTTLASYNKFYKPLITLKNKEFKQAYFKNRKIAENVDRSVVETNLFSNSKKYNRKKESYKLLEISDEIKQQGIGPSSKDIILSLVYTENKLETHNAKSIENEPMSYGVYDNE